MGEDLFYACQGFFGERKGTFGGANPLSRALPTHAYATGYVECTVIAPSSTLLNVSILYSILMTSVVTLVINSNCNMFPYFFTVSCYHEKFAEISIFPLRLLFHLERNQTVKNSAHKLGRDYRSFRTELWLLNHSKSRCLIAAMKR